MSVRRNLDEENRLMLEACMTYFGKYAGIVVADLPNRIAFYTFDGQLPRSDSFESKHVNACYVTKATMVPKRFGSSAGTLIVEESAFVVRFREDCPDTFLTMGRDGVVSLLGLWYPMDAVAAQCKEFARRRIRASISPEKMADFLRDVVVGGCSGCVEALGADEFKRMLEIRASEAVTVAMERKWDYILGHNERLGSLNREIEQIERELILHCQ